MINNTKVKVLTRRRRNESIDSLIKRFKKQYSKSGLMLEVQERMFYEKPGDKNRRKKIQCIRRIKKEKQKEIEREAQYKIMIAKKRRKEKDERNKHNSSNG